MTKPYSLDPRGKSHKRVAAEARSVRAVRHDLHGSVASVVRWSAASEDGSGAVGKMGGRRGAALSLENGAGSWSGIAAEPEVTVRGLVTNSPNAALPSAMARLNFIHREGMSFKKSVLPAEQDSPRRGAPPGAVEQISDED